jgi:hypothetical protein
VVEACSLQRKKHTKAWLVQLATGTKRKVVKVVESCPIQIEGFQTQADLNVLPLGSYDVLLGMDWLAAHKEKLNCYEKTLECEDEEGNTRILQGIQNPVSVRQISALQLKKYSRRGCPLYAIQILNSTESGEMKVEYHPVLWEFRDVFPEEVPGLPPKRDLEFSIDLVSGAVPTSRVPYRMSAPELVELNMQLKEMMEKVTSDRVCPRGEHQPICKEEGWNLKVMHRLSTVEQDDHQEQVPFS